MKPTPTREAIVPLSRKMRTHWMQRRCDGGCKRIFTFERTLKQSFQMECSECGKVTRWAKV